MASESGGCCFSVSCLSLAVCRRRACRSPFVVSPVAAESQSAAAAPALHTVNDMCEYITYYMLYVVCYVFI